MNGIRFIPHVSTRRRRIEDVIVVAVKKKLSLIKAFPSKQWDLCLIQRINRKNGSPQPNQNIYGLSIRRRIQRTL